MYAYNVYPPSASTVFSNLDSFASMAVSRSLSRLLYARDVKKSATETADNRATALPYNLTMHTYTVSLRIESRELDTAQITKELTRSPTQTRAVGEQRDARTVWDKALWEFQVVPEGRSNWDSLEIGLATLLSVFSSRTKTLQEYGKNHDVYIWCGHFSSSFAGGPHLSAEIPKKLGEFGIPLWLDTNSSPE